MLPEMITSDAVISPDGVYRYSLTRIWNPTLPLLLVCMLNPSTADGRQNDPTIRRLIGFAIALGFGGILVVNLCAARSTDPDRLPFFADPVGPENDAAIRAALPRAGMVIAAWGKLKARPPWLRERARKVLELLTEHADVHALRVTNEGFPSHPLYLPGHLRPVLFKARRRAA